MPEKQPWSQHVGCSPPCLGPTPACAIPILIPIPIPMPPQTPVWPMARKKALRCLSALPCQPHGPSTSPGLAVSPLPADIAITTHGASGPYQTIEIAGLPPPDLACRIPRACLYRRCLPLIRRARPALLHVRPPGCSDSLGPLSPNSQFAPKGWRREERPFSVGSARKIRASVACERLPSPFPIHLITDPGTRRSGTGRKGRGGCRPDELRR